jgi:hypothetical protein
MTQPADTANKKTTSSTGVPPNMVTVASMPKVSPSQMNATMPPHFLLTGVGTIRSVRDLCGILRMLLLGGEGAVLLNEALGDRWWRPQAP